MSDALERRIEELEIQAALQNDLLDSLSDMIANVQQQLDLQQAQLRLLYRRLEEKGQEAGQLLDSPTDNIPPHY